MSPLFIGIHLNETAASCSRAHATPNDAKATTDQGNTTNESASPCSASHDDSAGTSENPADTPGDVHRHPDKPTELPDAAEDANADADADRVETARAEGRIGSRG